MKPITKQLKHKIQENTLKQNSKYPINREKLRAFLPFSAKFE
jgi:hypothetical protein